MFSLKFTDEDASQYLSWKILEYRELGNALVDVDNISENALSRYDRLALSIGRLIVDNYVESTPRFVGPLLPDHLRVPRRVSSL